MERDTRRFEFRNEFTRIHLGLSLTDVLEMELEVEYQHYPKGKKAVMVANLRKNGATEEEIAYLFQDFDRLRSTRRVELNAMTSPQFVAFVERKLREHGIRKIVPEIDLLKRTYHQFAVGHAVKIEFDRVRKAIEAKAEKDLKLPDNLEQQVEQILKQHADLPWHQAVRSFIDPSILPPKNDPNGGKNDRNSGITVIGNLPEQIRDIVTESLGKQK